MLSYTNNNLKKIEKPIIKKLSIAFVLIKNYKKSGDKFMSEPEEGTWINAKNIEMKEVLSILKSMSIPQLQTLRKEGMSQTSPMRHLVDTIIRKKIQTR